MQGTGPPLTLLMIKIALTLISETATLKLSVGSVFVLKNTRSLQ